MRIGFDGKRFFNNYTGLGNYSRTLIENCAKFSPQNKYAIFSKSAPQNQQNQFAFENQSIEIFTPKDANLLWWSLGIKRDIKRKNIDLFHGLSAELPIKLNLPSVVTIHDLIFESHPEQYQFIDRKIYSAKAKYACKMASKIIAISEATKQDIIRFYKTSSDQIEVIYQACDEQFYQPISQQQLDEVSQIYQWPKRYLLYVGSIIERKNLKAIVEAIKLLRDNEGKVFHLVVIGSTSSQYAQEILDYVHKNELTNQIHFLSQVPFSDLPAIYKNSWLFVYPSDYEGFGIPILEAQAVGLPVITSNKSCLPEVAGPHSICLDDISGRSIAAAILSLNNDPARCEKMVEEGREYIKRFDAEKLTSQLIDLYQSLI